MTSRQEHDRIDAELHRVAKSSDPFAAAVRATRMPMLITDPNQPDNPIVFVNDAFSKLTGYERDEILGHNCRFLQGPKTDRADVARIRDAIERRVPIEIDLQNHKKNGEVFWNRLLISPVFDADGALTYYFASQFDVTLERERLVRLQRDRDALEQEVERRNDDLTRSESRLHFMLAAGRLGAWSLDLGDKRLVASDLCKLNFGRPVDEPFTFEDLVTAVVPEDRPKLETAMRAAIDRRGDYDVEHRVTAPGGEVRWVQLRGRAFYRADGAPLSMAGISLDVTDRKRADEQRTLLAAEMKHRVKNSIATVQSIAHQTLRNAASIQDAQKTLDARLNSLASAHDILTSESDVGATLAEAVESALQPFRVTPRGRIRVGGPEVRLTPRLTLAVVMALHELATNAAKYGGLSNDSGRVILNWEVEGRRAGEAPGLLRMRWEEFDGPPVEKPARIGFGTRMIERVLSAELGGSAAIEYRPRGLVFTVEAPLPEERAPPSPFGNGQA
ncbi:HWE histidine kinase domain-containing protein [Methylobacterium sp. Leaf118]|uniref:HWE histidine kinase domain-containing protein n=1 Tax=Methylobacterium sp. Leaf118 TaxID=2876562 RepID=UPI001E50EB5B|nr:PAS domain-containing protein [Methylobacterium sp. Leaf118]